MKFVVRSAGLLCAALVSCVLAGCGEPVKPTGKVKGTISHNGTAIPMGNLDIRSSTGVGAQVQILDGTFTFDTPIEAGEYQVAVSPPVPEPQAPGSPPPPPVTFDIPPKFQGLTTSGVTITIKEGENDIPIEFKD